MICQNFNFLRSDYLQPEVVLSQLNIGMKLQDHVFIC